VEIREADAFVCQPIDRWGLQDRIAVAGEIPVPLIIRKNDDDVWFGGGEALEYRGAAPTAAAVRAVVLMNLRRSIMNLLALDNWKLCLEPYTPVGPNIKAWL
jgi:hypothetical protein